MFASLIRTSYESWSGPMPPPRYLREYEDVAPGSAQLIFQMAARQATHRQDLEMLVIRGQDKRATQGMYIGGAAGLLVVVLGFVLVLTGRSLAGFGALVGDAAVFAGVFVYGRTQQRKERIEKAKLAPPPPPSPPLPFPE